VGAEIMIHQAADPVILVDEAAEHIAASLSPERIGVGTPVLVPKPRERPVPGRGCGRWWLYQRT
jgi:hypothetical protein